MILQGVKLTIQPLGVGYANRPKKAKMGGYVAFYPIYACLALIQQPLRGDLDFLKTLLPSARHLEEGKGTTILELMRLENCISRLCPRLLGSHPTPHTQIV